VDEGVTWRIIYRLETSKSGANMDKRKRAKLRAAGWTVGTPREFLGLSDEEAAFVEFKLALSKTLQELRTAQELSQVEVAKRLKSSQSRVAKMEASDPGVSVDLLSGRCSSLGHNLATSRKHCVRAAGSQLRDVASHGRTGNSTAVACNVPSRD
jgi:hypothetical protein